MYFLQFRTDIARTEYLSNADERLRWQASSLPADDLCTENAIMLKRFNRYFILRCRILKRCSHSRPDFAPIKETVTLSKHCFTVVRASNVCKSFSTMCKHKNSHLFSPLLLCLAVKIKLAWTEAILLSKYRLTFQNWTEISHWTWPTCSFSIQAFRVETNNAT